MNLIRDRNDKSRAVMGNTVEDPVWKKAIYRDDVLTLLIHLGYLGYRSEKRKVFSPNQEVADAFSDAVRGDGWEDVGQLIQDPEDLLEAT